MSTSGYVFDYEMLARNMGHRVRLHIQYNHFMEFLTLRVAALCSAEQYIDYVP